MTQRPGQQRFVSVARVPNDNLFILYRTTVEPPTPHLRCHVCDSSLEHGDFCPWPPMVKRVPLVVCAECYVAAVEYVDFMILAARRVLKSPHN